MGGNSLSAFWVPVTEGFLEEARDQQSAKALEGCSGQAVSQTPLPGQGLLIWGTCRTIAAVKIPGDTAFLGVPGLEERVL